MKRLVSLMGNGQVKIITGIRRCGKSFLLNTLFRNHLISSGVAEERIIMLDLDEDANSKYRNPLNLGRYIREHLSDPTQQYYVLIDEIQKVKAIPNPDLPKDSGDTIGFVDVLNGLKNIKNVDVYVTGSNSRMLSTDIATEFRGRGDIIPLHPLTYDEYYEAVADKRRAWREYVTYGGMPRVLSLSSHEEKAQYLSDLFTLIYIRDVIERNHLRADASVLDDLLNIVSSAVGSLTNPKKIADTFKTKNNLNIKSESISRYLDFFVESFVLQKSFRFDIKGRAYIDTPLKYYYSDNGLRNAKINFRQLEENHIMENILYNELVARGFSVDVGVVPYYQSTEGGKRERALLEVDFVVNKLSKRYYIQSALTVADEAKRVQETNSLSRIDDTFPKIVIVKDDITPRTDEKGIQYINIEDFLLERINDL